MLKNFKKLISFVLVLALSAVVSLPAFADKKTSTDSQIKDSSFTSINVLKDPDGTIHGSQIGVRNGKPVYEDLSGSVSAADKELISKKEAMVKAHTKYMQHRISKTAYITDLKKLGVDASVIDDAQKPASLSKSDYSSAASTDSAANTSNYITNLYQQSQQTYYWCGPATASEIIEAKTGGSYSQSDLESSLHCDTGGSPWYDGTYPMADTLNNCVGTGWYVPYGTQIDASTFSNDVITDIDSGYAVAGNAYEVVGGPHLAGHPNQNIFHWFAIDGYANSGTSIHYADSVHGASSISWSSRVPAYSSMNYKTLATIVDGRGIIW